MDMMPFEDFDLLEQRVQDMVREHHLPPEVKRVEVRFGDRWDGDPGVWIELYLAAGDEVSETEADMWGNLMLALSDGARRIVHGRIPGTRILADPVDH